MRTLDGLRSELTHFSESNPLAVAQLTAAIDLLSEAERLKAKAAGILAGIHAAESDRGGKAATTRDQHSSAG